MFNKQPTAQKEIASLIGNGTTIVGDVNFSGGLRIDGTVRGAVRCVEGEKAGMLVISELGAVEGEVRAAHLVVAGRINGPVHASELVELQPKARVSGDVHYRALEMHNGAIVDGTLMYTAGESTGKVPVGLKLAAPSAPRAEPGKVESQAG
jgi:cytoskeletal protein CcmA (bactofilin family)